MKSFMIKLNLDVWKWEITVLSRTRMRLGFIDDNKLGASVFRHDPHPHNTHSGHRVSPKLYTPNGGRLKTRQPACEVMAERHYNFQGNSLSPFKV